MSTTIIIPEKYFSPYDPSFYNEEIAEYVTFLLNLAYPRQYIGNRVHIEAPMISVENFHQVLALDNGDVKNWPAFQAVLATHIDDEIPEQMPDREYEVCIADCDGDNPIMETRIHHWRDYRDSGHPLPDPIEDPVTGELTYYYPTYSMGYTHDSATLLLIDGAPGVSLIDYEEIPFPVSLEGHSSKTVTI